MGAFPKDVARLKAQVEKLATKRRWSEIRDRLGRYDDPELVDEPKCAFHLAEALAHLGQMERALTLSLAAEAGFRTRHDEINLLASLNLAGAVQFETGDLVGAEDRFSALLELAREAGDDEMAGRATNNLGATASLRGEHERALSFFRLSVPAYQKLGFLLGLAQTSHNQAIAYRDLENWDEAERSYHKAMRYARQIGDDRLVAMARVGLAELSHHRGDQVYAEAESLQGVAAFEQIGDELGRADALRLLGSIATVKEDEETARARFEEALELALRNANPMLQAEILEARASLHLKMSRIALGRADLEVAVALYNRLTATERRQRVEDRLRSIAL